MSGECYLDNKHMYFILYDLGEAFTLSYTFRNLLDVYFVLMKIYI